MTINVNIPKVDTATFQPSFSKTVEFPGFTLYHSLKERYIIKSLTDVTSTFEPLLDELDLPGGFAYLIGGNTNNAYIAQCETAMLAKVQYNPVTADIIAEDRINIGDEVRALIPAPGAEVFLTCGYVEGNRILLGVCANPGVPTTMVGYILLSEDNGGTWNLYNFDQLQAPPPEGMPVAIQRINFYTNYYYAVLFKEQGSTDFRLYLLDEPGLEFLPLGTVPFLYMDNLSIGPTQFPGTDRWAINKEFEWNHNSLQFLTDDRTAVIYLASFLESGQWDDYPSFLPVEAFDFGSPGFPLATALYTDVENSTRYDDLYGFGELTFNYRIDNTITAGSSPFDVDSTDAVKGVLWATFNKDQNDFDNAFISNFEPYTDDTLLLWIPDQSPNLSVSRGQIFQDTTLETINLNLVPLIRFNSFENDFWGLEAAVSEPLPVGWLANDANSVWLSDRADTDTHDYGALDFDYLLTVEVDIPIAATVPIRAQYYGEILDIQIEGVAQGLSYSGNEGVWETINLVLPRGPSTITFEMRHPAAAGAGNPTGLRVEWDTLLDLGGFGFSYESDLLVDETDDKFYVVYDTFAWKCTLSTFTIDYCVDLHAEPLVFVPPYPPGYDPLVITGVTDDTHTPKGWKLLKNFNDIYCYNKYHDTSFSDVNDKEFYNWIFDETDPSGHTMFAAFELPIETIVKLEYFYDVNTDLFIMICNNDGGYETNQYRLNGLAQFNQITTSPVLVGPIVFNTVTLDPTGIVYVSEDDVQTGYSSAANTLFVYEVQDPGDIENSSYLIPIDEDTNAFDYAGIESIPGLDFLGRRGKYFYLPGDYKGQGIVGSDIFRDETNTDLTNNFNVNTFGSVTHTQNRLLGAPDPTVYDVKYDNEWAYFLLPGELIRGRAVYYPDIPFGGG